MTPVAIAVAPNGARRTKADHPALPMTPSEIAATARACADAGATLIHLHVRDDAGRHSLDPGRYAAAIAAIDRAVGPRLIVQITTEAVGIYSPAEQMAAVRSLRPAAFSVALKELMPQPADEAAGLDFLAWAAAAGCAPQYIVYSPAEAARLQALQAAGRLPQTAPHALFVLGRYSVGQQSDPFDLLSFLADWPPTWPWSVCAFGTAETRCAAAALTLGGHVRVGFENSLWRPDGTPAADNAETVARIAGIAGAIGRPVADSEAARAIYGTA